MSAYEEASELEQDRRFDEAMDQFWRALRIDPTNLSVRLRLGQLQEKAGLFLAALTNYQRVLAFANPGTKNLPRGLYRWGARREWDRAACLAKYRATVLLGEGSILEKWSNTQGEDEISYRKRFREEFRALLKPLSHTNAERRDPATAAIAAATTVLLNSNEELRADQKQAAQKEIMTWAYEAANELKLSLPHLELRPRSQPVTRRTVALGQACIQTRYELISSPRPVTRQMLDQLDRQVRRSGCRVGRWLKWAPPRLRRWQWHEHYNAACLYAIALTNNHDCQSKAVDVAVHRDLVRRAINRLERAITLRESKFLDSWRDWVVSEDPDLRALRTEPAFAAFETMYFPKRVPLRAPAQRLREEPYRLVESRYTRDLLDTLAQRWHDKWHARAAKGITLDRHALLGWCSEELEVWSLVGEVAVDGYDWRIRQRLLERANEILALDAPILVRFCRYEDVSRKLDHAANDGGRADLRQSPDAAARAERKLAEESLVKLAGVLRGTGSAATQRGRAHFERWSAAMRKYDAHQDTAMPPRWAADLCIQHAAVWQRMSDLMRAADLTQVTDAYADFAQELRDASHAWDPGPPRPITGGSSPRSREPVEDPSSHAK